MTYQPEIIQQAMKLIKSITEILAISTQQPQKTENRTFVMNPRQSENQENKAVQVKHSNPSFRDTAKGKGVSSTEQYDHCKKSGHNRDGCWFLHPHLRPVREKGDRGKWGRTKKEKKFGGAVEKDERIGSEGARAEPTQPSHNFDGAGSSVAYTIQLNQLLTQLNSLLQQQTTVLYILNLI